MLFWFPFISVQLLLLLLLLQTRNEFFINLIAAPDWLHNDSNSIWYQNCAYRKTISDNNVLCIANLIWVDFRVIFQLILLKGFHILCSSVLKMATLWLWLSYDMVRIFNFYLNYHKIMFSFFLSYQNLLNFDLYKLYLPIWATFCCLSILTPLLLMEIVGDVCVVVAVAFVFCYLIRL